MADIEKVIERIHEAIDTGVCVDLFMDILALLKEQESAEPFHKCIGKSFSLIEDSNYHYCPYCGKPITWEGR